MHMGSSSVHLSESAVHSMQLMKLSATTGQRQYICGRGGLMGWRLPQLLIATRFYPSLLFMIPGNTQEYSCGDTSPDHKHRWA